MTLRSKNNNGAGEQIPERVRILEGNHVLPQENRASQRNPLPNQLSGDMVVEHLARNYRQIGIPAVAGAATVIKLTEKKEARERVLPAFLREDAI
jgi:erythromycin esterase-like protein